MECGSVPQRAGSLPSLAEPHLCSTFCKSNGSSLLELLVLGTLSKSLFLYPKQPRISHPCKRMGLRSHHTSCTAPRGNVLPMHTLSSSSLAPMLSSSCLLTALWPFPSLRWLRRQMQSMYHRQKLHRRSCHCNLRLRRAGSCRWEDRSLGCGGWFAGHRGGCSRSRFGRRRRWWWLSRSRGRYGIRG